MASEPAALDGSRPASIFKITASEMLIWGISGTLGLNVPGIFSSLRVPSASPSSTALSETDCRWLVVDKVCFVSV